MNNELKMSVSPICVKNNEKYAFVSFTDGIRVAEGRIPDCKMLSSNGFTPEEVAQLEDYMRRELTQLKKMAVGIRLIDAIIK